MSSTKKTPLVFHLDPEIIELLENLSLEKDKPASVPLPEKDENNIKTSKYVKTTQKISDKHENVLENNAPTRDKSLKTNSDKIFNVDVETPNRKHINVFEFKDEERLPRNEIISSNEEQENGFKFQNKGKTLSDLDIAYEQLNSKFSAIELADNSNLNEINHETSSYRKLQDDEVLEYKKGKEKIRKEKESVSWDLLGKKYFLEKSKGGCKLIERGKEEKNRSDPRVKEYDIHHRSLRYPNGQHLHRTSTSQAVNNDLHSSPEHLSHIQLQSYDSSRRNFIPFEEDDCPWNGLQFEDSSECVPQFSDLVSDLHRLINSPESSTENLNGVATTLVSGIQNSPVNYVPFQQERFNPVSSINELEPSVNFLNDTSLLDQSYSKKVPEDISRGICSKDYSCSPSSQSGSSCSADYLYYDTEATVPCGTEKFVETVSEKTERLVKYLTRVNHKPQDNEPSLPVLTANDTDEFFKTLSKDISTSYNTTVPEENIITRDNHLKIHNCYKESENQSNFPHVSNVENSRKCESNSIQGTNEFISSLQMHLSDGNNCSSVDHVNNAVSKSYLSTSVCSPPEPVKDTDTIGKAKESECIKKSPNNPCVYSCPPTSKTQSRPIQCVLKTSAKQNLFHSSDFDKNKFRSECERLYREIQEQQLGTEDKKIIHRLKKQRSTNYGGTNLHDALSKRNLERFYCILEIHKQFHKSVFDVNTRDTRRKTVLDYARKLNLHSVIEYLEENEAVESITLDG